MPLTPITFRTTHEPFRLRLASTSQSSVQVVAPATVTFLDDNTGVTYYPTSAPTAAARSIYDGTTTTIDGTSDNWLLIAVKGLAYPAWVKERDFGTIETLVANRAWAPLRMLAGGILYPLFLQPVWSQTPGGTTALTFVSSTGDPNIQILSLWNGSGNNAPPSGWQDATFTPAGWQAPVDTGYAVIPGATSIWSAVHAASATQECILRHVFTVPAGLIAQAALEFAIDDEVTGIWVNGHFLYSHTPGPFGSTYGPTANVPVGWLVADGTTQNVLAIAHANVYPPDAFITYRLTVTHANIQGPVVPATNLPDATPTTIGAVEIDQIPPSGHPVVLTVVRLGAASGVASLDASAKLPLTELPAHESAHQAGGSDGLTGDLDATARVAVAVNNGPIVGARRQIDVKAGANVTVTAIDDSANERIKIVISVPNFIPPDGLLLSGCMIFYNGTDWQFLGPGTEGQTLKWFSGAPTWS